MTDKLAKTYNEQLLEIRDLYRAAGEPWPATSRQIAIWAINNGHYNTHHAKILAKAAEEFSQAMGQEYYTDDQGRRVRLMHCAKTIKKDAEGNRSQLPLWDDIRTADRKFMERAFQQRRRHIVGECRQLKNDVDSWNDGKPTEEPIQLVLDFAEDVAEMSLPTEYRPNQPR
jgi:hypothetical protein